MNDLPEITGRINITRANIENGVQYTHEIVGGDVVGVSLEAIRDMNSDFLRINNGYIIIGQIGLTVLGYRDGYLVCRVAFSGDSE